MVVERGGEKRENRTGTGRVMIRRVAMVGGEAGKNLKFKENYFPNRQTDRQIDRHLFIKEKTLENVYTKSVRDIMDTS